MSHGEEGHLCEDEILQLGGMQLHQIPILAAARLHLDTAGCIERKNTPEIE